MLKTLIATACATMTLAAAASTQAMDISGAGSTFAAPIYGKWAEGYKAATGSNLNYQSIGSGGGIKQIEASTVQFGATDKPLSAADLAAQGLSQFPTVNGGVVPAAAFPACVPASSS